MALKLEQWKYVANNQLGLRAAANPTDINGAGFALTDLQAPKILSDGPPPQDWEDKLEKTIPWMRGFASQNGRPYILLLNNVVGSVYDYAGVFPKANLVRNATILDCKEFSKHDDILLYLWIFSHLPG